MQMFYNSNSNLLNMFLVFRWINISYCILRLTYSLILNPAAIYTAQSAQEQSPQCPSILMHGIPTWICHTWTAFCKGQTGVLSSIWHQRFVRFNLACPCQVLLFIGGAMSGLNSPCQGLPNLILPSSSLVVGPVSLWILLSQTACRVHASFSPSISALCSV